MSTLEFDDESGTKGSDTGAELESVGARKRATGPGAAPQTAKGSEQAAANEPDAKSAAVAPRNVYTVLAREGVNAAQLINARLAKKTIGKVDPRRVEVATPHGPSTSGGKKARQSITLIPVSGDAPAIMFGWMDVAQKVAELR